MKLSKEALRAYATTCLSLAKRFEVAGDELVFAAQAARRSDYEDVSAVVAENLLAELGHWDEIRDMVREVFIATALIMCDGNIRDVTRKTGVSRANVQKLAKEHRLLHLLLGRESGSAGAEKPRKMLFMNVLPTSEEVAAEKAKEATNGNV